MLSGQTEDIMLDGVSHNTEKCQDSLLINLNQGKKIDSEQTRCDIPKESEDDFDFIKIWEESSLQNLWHDRKWKEIGTTAAKKFILGFLSSCFDVFSDAGLFKGFLWGAEYTKTVDNLSHPYVNSTNCTLMYKTSVHSWTGNDWTPNSLRFTFSCLEFDPVFAWFTLAFLLWPGVPFFIFIFKSNKKCIPFIMIPFPILLILVKFIAIFHTGKEFKKLVLCMSSIEGTFEAGPQLCVQIFIIFSRGDRQPNFMQWFSLFTSLITVNLPQIEKFNAGNRKAQETQTETLNTNNSATENTDIEQIECFVGHKLPAIGVIQETITLFPLFLFTTLFRIFSFSIFFVLFRYYAVFFYFAILVAVYTVGLTSSSSSFRFMHLCAIHSAFTIINIDSSLLNRKFWKKNISYTQEETKQCNIRYRKFHMLIWTILNTITLVSIAIIGNLVEVNFEVFGVEHSWSSLPIIDDIYLLNSIIGFTLGCGVISHGLFLWQVEHRG